MRMLWLPTVGLLSLLLSHVIMVVEQTNKTRLCSLYAVHLVESLRPYYILTRDAQ